MTRLRDAGHALAFVSHRLEEVLAITDRVTVLREGRTVAAGLPTRGLTQPDIIKLMAGREMGAIYGQSPPSPSAGAPAALEIERLAAPPRCAMCPSRPGAVKSWAWADWWARGARNRRSAVRPAPASPGRHPPGRTGHSSRKSRAGHARQHRLRTRRPPFAKHRAGFQHRREPAAGAPGRASRLRTRLHPQADRRGAVARRAGPAAASLAGYRHAGALRRHAAEDTHRALAADRTQGVDS